MVRCCVRNTGFVVFELLKLISLGFNQASFHALLPSFSAVCSLTALLSQFFDVSEVLSHQPAQLNQDLSQFIGIPRGRSSLTQFPGLILRVHDSPFQSRVPLGVVNFRDGQLVCRVRPLVHASSCKASWQRWTLFALFAILRFRRPILRVGNRMPLAGLLRDRRFTKMTDAFGKAAVRLRTSTSTPESLLAKLWRCLWATIKKYNVTMKPLQKVLYSI